MAAQLSQPLTSGQRSPSHKATFVSSSFTLPEREKAEVEEGCVRGKTDDVGGSSGGFTDVGINFMAFLQVSPSHCKKNDKCLSGK